MSKGGEQHASDDNSYVDDNGYRVGESSRPRALFAGVMYTYGLLTMFQGTMIQYLRHIFIWYIHGLTSTQLSERISKFIKPDYDAVMYDGSSYDALQHHSIMKIVDTVLWKTIGKTM